MRIGGALVSVTLQSGLPAVAHARIGAPDEVVTVGGADRPASGRGGSRLEA